jgi:hypothetical protein
MKLHTAKRKRQIRKALERLHKRIRAPRRRVPEKMLAASEAAERLHIQMRKALRRSRKFEPLRCTMLIHRVILTVDYHPINDFFAEWLSRIPGLLLGPAKRLWRQHYAFVRRISGIANLSDGSVEYAKTNGWAAPLRITLVPRIPGGFKRRDLETIFNALPNFTLVAMEVAWDFPIESEVDVQYVERSGIFGKSRPRNVGINPMYSSWGSRKGQKLVRSYARPETQAHRVELELHARFLRAYGINSSDDFPRLVNILIEKHIAFFRLDRKKLNRQLQRNGFSAQKQQLILEQVGDRKADLYDALRYLRRHVHLTNVQRLCRPDKLDSLVVEAAQRWIAIWNREMAQEVERG